MKHIGHLVGKTLKNYQNEAILAEIRAEVEKIAVSHPMFSPEWISADCRDLYESMYLK